MKVGQVTVLSKKDCLILYYGLLSDYLSTIGRLLFSPLVLFLRRLLLLLGCLLVSPVFPTYLVNSIAGLLPP